MGQPGFRGPQVGDLGGDPASRSQARPNTAVNWYTAKSNTCVTSTLVSSANRNAWNATSRCPRSANTPRMTNTTENSPPAMAPAIGTTSPAVIS